MDSLAAVERLLRDGGRTQDAAFVAGRAPRATHDRDEAVALWLWLADLKPPEGVVGEWDQAVAAYLDEMRRLHQR